MSESIPWEEIEGDGWAIERPPKRPAGRRRFLRRREPVRPPVSPWMPCADCPAPGLCREIQPERCR